MFGESDKEEEFKGFRAEDIGTAVDRTQKLVKLGNVINCKATAGCLDRTEAGTDTEINRILNVVVEKLVPFS